MRAVVFYVGRSRRLFLIKGTAVSEKGVGGRPWQARRALVAGHAESAMARDFAGWPAIEGIASRVATFSSLHAVSRAGARCGQSYQQ